MVLTSSSASGVHCRCGNVASILIFDENLNRDVRYFTETVENSTMMAPRAAARYFW
jgi:serine/threonine-protein phosphatase 6 catalytic subunit